MGDDGLTGGAAPAHDYLFALTDAGGTVPPELGVVRRLTARGHRVRVLADATMAEAARRTGAEVRLWSSNGVGEFQDWKLRSPTAMARGMAEYFFVGPAPAQAIDTAAAIAERRPDLVVASFAALGAMVAAESAGLPFDVLIPNIYALPVHGATPFGAGLKPAHGPAGRLRDRVVRSATTRLFDRYALEPADALRVQYGLPPVAHTWDQLHAARRQLILTSADFDFPAELPPNARYVGPVLDDPLWAGDADWTEPPGDGPLVLVAMSSTFQNHVAELQRIADALGRLRVRGLITTGPAVRPDEIHPPANVTVVAAAPHTAVLRSAELVVTHGGHGTVVKALAAGVPLVILPHGRDQADNAVRVASRGAGRTLSRRTPAPRIARAVDEVLRTPGYRQAAERLGAAIRRDATGGALLDELEALDPVR